MKKLVFINLFLLCATLLLAQGERKRVLFIGNSYTEVNNLPDMVQRVAESTGDVLEYQSNTPGGCTFQQHCTNRSMDLIRQGGWDVVVLQEQSQLPSFPQSQVEVEVFPYAQRLVDSVYAHSPEGEAMFYMTWGRKNGDQGNAHNFPVLGTYEGMDSMLYERYLYMAREYDASVCPVGRVWRYLRTNSPRIELYQPDESHPSLEGSYAAACAFYTMLFHRSPLTISYRPEIDETDAATIREAVHRVVFDTLSFWLMRITESNSRTGYTDTTHIDTTHTDTTQVGTGGILEKKTAFQVCPNPTTDYVTVVSSQPLNVCEATLFDLNGRKLRSVRMSGAHVAISLSDLPKGLYLLNVVSSTNKFVTHVVKQ